MAPAQEPVSRPDGASPWSMMRSAASNCSRAKAARRPCHASVDQRLHRVVGANVGPEIAFHRPDRHDDLRRDAVVRLDPREQPPLGAELVAPTVDPRVVDRAVQVAPDRPDEIRLAAVGGQHVGQDAQAGQAPVNGGLADPGGARIKAEFAQPRVKIHLIRRRIGAVPPGACEPESRAEARGRQGLPASPRSSRALPRPAPVPGNSMPFPRLSMRQPSSLTTTILRTLHKARPAAQAANLTGGCGGARLGTTFGGYFLFFG